MSTPDSEIVNAALRRIEADSKHPTRKLAAQLITAHRTQRASQLTQAQIDSADVNDEERRRRFVGNAVAFRRRSLLSRLTFWR